MDHMIHLQYQGYESFLVEERRAEKIQKIETKHFPACFTKKGLKTNDSLVEERCPKLYKVDKR